MIASVLSGQARYCVITGDNREVLPTLPAGSIAACIMDPPYDEHTHAKSRAGSRKEPLRDGNGRISKCAISREVSFGFDPIGVEDMDRIGDECARVTTRWTLAFCNVESAHLWIGALRSAGLDYCRTGAWIKIGATPQFTGDRPSVGFEAVVICHPKGRKRWNGGGSPALWSHLTCIERGGQARGNNSRVHPTQKPLDLMLELVSLFTDTDDLILDPFCGSGTTLVAALRLGRRAIGIEREPRWADLSRERCQAELEGSTLQARRAGQIALFAAGGGK